MVLKRAERHNWVHHFDLRKIPHAPSHRLVTLWSYVVLLARRTDPAISAEDARLSSLLRLTGSIRTA
jgi:hypothetical protein